MAGGRGVGGEKADGDCAGKSWSKYNTSVRVGGYKQNQRLF